MSALLLLLLIQKDVPILSWSFVFEAYLTSSMEGLHSMMATMILSM